MIDGLTPGAMEQGSLPPEPELGPYRPAHPIAEVVTFTAGALLLAAAARFVINRLVHHEENHAQ